ncbi:hypothetical protein TNCT_433661 [Trichonephila clavata]|uniref:Uncharacterized protein n=1 Tax=Trichonephila clavata TaxID=2740835 RepID=A0A8X6IAK9_TRICU|nr:hypothetical protein TNCT_433661 [Trichonephila clavata]
MHHSHPGRPGASAGAVHEEVVVDVIISFSIALCEENSLTQEAAISRCCVHLSPDGIVIIIRDIVQVMPDVFVRVLIAAEGTSNHRLSCGLVDLGVLLSKKSEKLWIPCSNLEGTFVFVVADEERDIVKVALTDVLKGAGGEYVVAILWEEGTSGRRIEGPEHIG